MSLSCMKTWLKDKISKKLENFDEYLDPGSPKLFRKGVDNDMEKNFPYIFGKFKSLHDNSELGQQNFTATRASRLSESYLDDEILSETSI